MHFDGTVTLGNVIQIVLTVGAVFLAWARIREQLAVITTKIDPIWAEYNRRIARRRVADREDA